MPTPAAALPRRLHRNRGRYEGEGIDIAAVLGALEREAVGQGWQAGAMDCGAGLSLCTLQRPGTGRGPRVYLSAGIHADEPAGPLAVLELVRRNLWPAGLSLWICPCLNPSGFPFNRRENAGGLDLNRDYRHLKSAEVRAHVAWLAARPQFDATLCLHEDWEASGFYLYELNPEGRPSAAERVIERVQAVCPVETAPVVDGREARGGIIRPSLDPAVRLEWPEAFYLLQHKTRHSYTLEAPSDFDLAVRVSALTVAAEALLDTLATAVSVSR